MSTGWIVLIVVLVILIGVLVGLYFFGKKSREEAGSTAGTDGCHGADCQHADHRIKRK